MGAGEAGRVPPSAFYVEGEAGGVTQNGPGTVQPVSVEVDGKEHFSLDLGGGCRGQCVLHCAAVSVGCSAGSGAAGTIA